MKKHDIGSAEWRYAEEESPLTIHYHFYKGPEVKMYETQNGGMQLRDMSQLVITDVTIKEDSVLEQLSQFVTDWDEFDRFIDDLEYVLSGDCE